jgi:hypothetical protein
LVQVTETASASAAPLLAGTAAPATAAIVAARAQDKNVSRFRIARIGNPRRALAIHRAIKTWARRNFKEQISAKAQFFS